MDFDVGDFGGGVIGGIGSLVGSYFQGKQNQQNQRDQFYYNMALQQQAQEWNLYLSNTQYQRGVADLKAAGINPILAAGGFSPFNSGSSGGSVGQAESTNPIEGGISSARQALSLGAQLAQTKENTKLTAAQVQTEKDKQSNLKQDTRLKVAQGAQAISGAARNDIAAQRENQTMKREGQVGNGDVRNLGTWATIFGNAVRDKASPSSNQVGHSAKSRADGVGPYGSLRPGTSSGVDSLSPQRLCEWGIRKGASGPT